MFNILILVSVEPYKLPSSSVNVLKCSKTTWVLKYQFEGVLGGSSLGLLFPSVANVVWVAVCCSIHHSSVASSGPRLSSKRTLLLDGRGEKQGTEAGTSHGQKPDHVM